MPLYSLNKKTKLSKKVWDNELVIYLEDSRETHLLGAPCLVMLDLLESGPVSQIQLESSLQFLLEVNQSEEASKLSMQVIDSLHRIGLLDVHESIS